MIFNTHYNASKILKINENCINSFLFCYVILGGRNFESVFSDFSLIPSNGYKRRKDPKQPFKCDICSYTTVYSSHFKDHMRIHTGNKPYSCHYCGKNFTQKQNLKKHVVCRHETSFLNLIAWTYTLIYFVFINQAIFPNLKVDNIIIISCHLVCDNSNIYLFHNMLVYIHKKLW